MRSKSPIIAERSGTNQGALNTPVLLLIFNRPQTTRAVVESLRVVRPTRLYVAADGPRKARADDSQLCEEARRVAQAVDWHCEILKLFRDENAGCAVNVSSAITWFFEHVEEGIILEDDCVPTPSFFQFCEALLAHYRNEPKIMHIAGTNLQYGRRRGRASYYFSRYPNVWGWASWRRAWKHYDFSLRPSWRLGDTWDTQWQLSIQKTGGLSIVPGVNLVKNIGFGPGATHTSALIGASFLETKTMHFPLDHPRALVPDQQADIFTYYVHHRLVKHHWLIWWYRLVDLVRLAFGPVKRRLLGSPKKPSQERSL